MQPGYRSTPAGRSRYIGPVLGLILLVTAAIAAPTVEDGVLDLRGWDPAEDPIVSMAGDWRFAPGWVPEPAGTISVPGSWNDALGGAQGSGTYAVTLRLPAGAPPLAFSPGRAVSSHRIWLGGTLLAQSGDPETIIPIVPLPEGASGDALLRVEVKNAHSARGGLRETVLIGTEDALERRELVRTCETVLFAGCALIFGIYHLLLWSNRRHETAKLAFGLFCLLVAARIPLLHETLLSRVGLFEGLWTLRLRIEYLTFYLGVPLYYWVLQLTFPQDVRPWLLRATLSVCGAMALTVVFLPPPVFTAGLWVVQLTSFVTIFPALYFVVQAARAGRPGSRSLLMGTFTFAAFGTYELFLPGRIPLTNHAFLFVLIGQAHALARAFARAYDDIAALSEELREAHRYNVNILQSLENGVISIDTDGNIVTSNAAAGRILGLAPPLTNKPLRSLLEPPDRNLLLRLAQADAPSSLVDAAVKRNDGDEITVNLSGAPLRTATGDLIGHVLVIEDISREHRMKRTLSRYLHAELADQLIQQDRDLLGGRAEDATVLFADLRGFTTISEQIGPQATVQMLNEYFSMTADEILQRGGVIDKYIGDAIMAVFGILQSSAAHPRQAVECALGMLRAVDRLNARRAARGEPPLHAGIGINSGTVIAGNIGAPQRMDYTVVGDGVNLASRLEGVTKKYNVSLLISGSTQDRLGDDPPPHRLLDRIAVKGATKPVRIYEVLSKPLPHLDTFVTAQARYAEGRWEEAIRGFDTVLRATPTDGPAQILRARSMALLRTGGLGWDGVWRFDSK